MLEISSQYYFDKEKEPELNVGDIIIYSGGEHVLVVKTKSSYFANNYQDEYNLIRLNQLNGISDTWNSTGFQNLKDMAKNLHDNHTNYRIINYKDYKMKLEY